MLLDLVKIFIPAVLSFAIGIGITPILTHYLYANRMWKKRGGKVGLDGKDTLIFNRLHESRETQTPRLGGIVIWLSAAVAVLGVSGFAAIFDTALLEKLDFLNRNQTLIPLIVLLLGASIGLVDDLFEIRGSSRGGRRDGLSLRNRLLLVTIIGLAAGFWFYVKLDVSTISIPFSGPFSVGVFLIPLFAIVTLAIYSGGIIDGIDGLAGGIFAIIFGAYGALAFFQNQINIAAFCAAILGGILAFLWFNIPPARFYMSETGSMALTLTLTIIAFMTDTLGEGEGLFVLPVIALPLFLTSLSVIVQTFSKRFWSRRVFKIAPLHHHFEAIGWPPYKVTMRYWILGVVFAIIGVTIALVS